MQTISGVLSLVQNSLQEKLKNARLVVDGTVGNGNDLLFLAENTPTTCRIYGFDIQETAILHAMEKITAYQNRVILIQAGHENIASVLKDKIDAAIFNLGYLPGADHQVTTIAETTLQGIKAVLNQLSLNGVLVVVVYPGHAEGKRESVVLDDYFARLPVKEFTAGCYRLVNHKATAPYAYVIERVKV